MWKEMIITGVAAVIMTLVAIVLRRSAAALKVMLEQNKAAAQEAGNKAAIAAYDMALAVLDSITEITVGRIEATQAAAIRKAVKSGEKPFTELTQCGEDAYQDIVAQLSPYVMSALETCVADTERLIRNKIEEVLPKVKQEYRMLEESETELPDAGKLPWDIDTEGGGQ